MFEDVLWKKGCHPLTPNDVRIFEARRLLRGVGGDITFVDEERFGSGFVGERAKRASRENENFEHPQGQPQCERKR